MVVSDVLVSAGEDSNELVSTDDTVAVVSAGVMV
jgi:hypothetical protein